MNNSNTQQPNVKIPGIVANLLVLAAAGNFGAGHQAKMLLTNGGRAPIPFKMMNQRQKRKLASQMR